MSTPSPVEIYLVALERRELLLQQCRDCGQHLIAPVDACTNCGGSHFKWLEANGWGVVLGSSGLQTSSEGRQFHQVSVKLTEGLVIDAPLIGETSETIKPQTTVLAHVAPWEGELAILFTCQTEDDDEW
jgi:uncharacterized OB-fold protein